MPWDQKAFRLTMLWLLVLGLVAMGEAQALQPVLQLGHISAIEAVAVSPDGKTIASGSEDGEIRLWDRASGFELKTLAAQHPINQLLFSPDGRWLVASGRSPHIEVWDRQRPGQVFRLAKHTDTVRGLAFDHSGKQLASCAEDGGVLLWDLTTRRVRKTFRIDASSPCTAIALSPDGQHLAAATLDMNLLGDEGSKAFTLLRWDLKSGRASKVIKAHSAVITALVYARDGQKLISAAHDHLVQIWDARSGKNLKTLTGHSNAISSASLSPDGQQLVTASHDKTARVWTLANGKHKRFQGHQDRVSASVFTPDGKQLVTASADKTLGLWDTATGQRRRILAGPTPIYTAAAFSPDGREALLGSWDRTLKRWDVLQGKPMAGWPAHSDPVTGVRYAPAGSLAASTSAANDLNPYQTDTVKLWRLPAWQPPLTLKGHALGASSLAFAPDGQWLVSGGWDGSLKVWDAITGQERQSWPAHEYGASCVAVSRDGQWIASGGMDDDNLAKIWDAASGQLLHTLKGHTNTVLSVAFSPDGRHLVSAGVDDTIRLWDTATSQAVGQAKGIFPAVFSLDGQALFFNRFEGHIEMWDAGLSKQVRSLPHGARAVTALALSPDSRFLLATLADKRIQLWHIPSGQLVYSLLLDQAGEYLILTPDGNLDGSEQARQHFIHFASPQLELQSQAEGLARFYKPEAVREWIAEWSTTR